jgi:hypothetical protein
MHQIHQTDIDDDQTAAAGSKCGVRSAFLRVRSMPELTSWLFASAPEFRRKGPGSDGFRSQAGFIFAAAVYSDSDRLAADPKRVGSHLDSPTKHNDRLTELIPRANACHRSEGIKAAES